MNTKTKLYESLEAFVDAVANNDPEAERDSMKSYITAKTKVTLEGNGESNIKLDGDDVLVAGKKVGTLTHDLEDANASIQFEAADGEKAEFASLEELYGHLAEKFSVKEDAINEDDVAEGVADVQPAVTKQKTAAGKRTKRMADSKKTKQPDGKEGSYDGGSDVNMSDAPAHSGHEVDDRHKKGYYDQKDPRPDHKDKIKGGSDAAHPGGASDIETKGGYDKHDVRKSHKQGDHKTGGSATTKGKHDSK